MQTCSGSSSSLFRQYIHAMPLIWTLILRYSNILMIKWYKKNATNDFNLTGDIKKWPLNEQIFHTSDIHYPRSMALTHDPICILLYPTSNFWRLIKHKICNQQWFQSEWRMLKMTHKWELCYTPNIHLPQLTEPVNSLLCIVYGNTSKFCWCVNDRGAHMDLSKL